MSIYMCSIGRPLSSYVCVVCQHIQTASPLKPLGQLKPNFIWSLLGVGGGGGGNESLFK